MNNKYRVLAAVSLVLFCAAFACFLIGFRSQTPGMIGAAFLIVSFTLFIGLITNRALSKEAAQSAALTPAPISKPITASRVSTSRPRSEPLAAVATGSLATDSERLRAAAVQSDPTDLIVSIVFGAITFLFLSAGIWIIFFGHQFLFG